MEYDESPELCNSTFEIPDLNLQVESGEVLDKIQESIYFDSLSDLLIDDNENLDSFIESTSKEQTFLNNLAKITIEENVSSGFITKLLKILNETILPEAPLDYSTLLKRYTPKADDYIYYSRCSNFKCQKIIKFERKAIMKEKKVKCLNCKSIIDWNDEYKSSVPQTASFSIEDQLREISNHLNLNHHQKANEFTINLILTLDGIPLSDSSGTELWPLVCYIENVKSDKKLMNNLPIFKTFTILNNKNKNFKPSNPEQSKDYLLMLTPLIDELNEIKLGFETKWSKKTKMNISMFIGDAPCRHDVVNFLRHNGTYPCLRCKIVFKKNGNIKRFPLLTSTQIESQKLERKIEDVQASIRAKNSSKLKHHEGIKGESILSQIENFNYIEFTIVDLMHCVFLGVYKQFIIGYLTEKNRPYSIKDTSKIDLRLKELKPPSNFARKLRSIKEYPNYKSIEFQNHLFYLSYFIFNNVLTDEYLSHQLLLSSAIFKLYSPNSTDQQLLEAKKQIDYFLIGILKLKYSDAFYKYNSHVLPHLYKDRMSSGPLSFITQYSLEGQLQVLKGYLISKNKKVETLAKKASMQRVFNLQNLSKLLSTKVELKNRIYFLENYEKTQSTQFIKNVNSKAYSLIL